MAFWWSLFIVLVALMVVFGVVAVIAFALIHLSTDEAECYVVGPKEKRSKLTKEDINVNDVVLYYQNKLSSKKDGATPFKMTIFKIDDDTVVLQHFDNTQKPDTLTIASNVIGKYVELCPADIDSDAIEECDSSDDSDDVYSSNSDSSSDDDDDEKNKNL